MEEVRNFDEEQRTEETKSEETRKTDGASKLLIGGLLAAGTAIGVLGTKVIVPGCKKLGSAVKAAFKKEDKDKAPEEEASKEESEDPQKETTDKKSKKK